MDPVLGRAIMSYPEGQKVGEEGSLQKTPSEELLMFEQHSSLEDLSPERINLEASLYLYREIKKLYDEAVNLFNRDDYDGCNEPLVKMNQVFLLIDQMKNLGYAPLDEELFEMQFFYATVALEVARQWSSGLIHKFEKLESEHEAIDSKFIKQHQRICWMFKWINAKFSTLYEMTQDSIFQNKKIESLSAIAETHEFYGYFLLLTGYPEEGVSKLNLFLNLHRRVRSLDNNLFYPIDLNHVYQQLALGAEMIGNEGLARHYRMTANRLLIRT